MKPAVSNYSLQSPDEAILAAVAYADLFDYCLSNEEVLRLAVGRIVGISDLETVVDKRLHHQDGYWCLSGREGLIEAARVSQKEKQRKLALVAKWEWLLGLLPGVLMVGVTGSVAGGNPAVDDDIDLLIICRSDRLWLSRLILSSCLSLAGKRRKPSHADDQVKDLFCLNMWLNTKSLTEQADIYSANELARVIPIVNRQQTFERYMAANGWMRSYLPNALTSAETIEPWRLGQWSLFELLGDMGERLSMALLKAIMRRPSVEYVTDDRLLFHPGNHRQQILDNYEARLRELGIEVDLKTKIPLE